MHAGWSHFIIIIIIIIRSIIIIRVCIRITVGDN